ncbi:MAG: hypothetical protein VB080_01020 [Propionicimonas sp.]|uniref:hypothetical protein n=1 Tax=Propionicimonas sp. TaxID=1955623 RepID=UPI002B21A661|nr:hypothetical protein [Propionicimonas sp.]MEA4942995.1 hypothetical protein [Propionicimonas sp.]MEA5053189.1 hypothetical protein [Propionicimonas sp.]MEA5118413.1 hypothetical protein [Propionicimonas sp.]
MKYLSSVRPPSWWGVRSDLDLTYQQPDQAGPSRLIPTKRFGVELSGATLATVGLAQPAGLPESAVLCLAEAVD